jgi:hypothetical protein
MPNLTEAFAEFAAAPQVYNYVPNPCGMVHIVVRTARPGQSACRCSHAGVAPLSLQLRAQQTCAFLHAKHTNLCQVLSRLPQVGDAGNSEGLSGLNYYTNTFDHRAPQQHTAHERSSSPLNACRTLPAKKLGACMLTLCASA